MRRFVLLLTLLVTLIAAASASASQYAVFHPRYWPLDVGNTWTGWTGYYYQPTWPAPSSSGAYYTTNPPSKVPHPFAVGKVAWFNVTVAWDAKNLDLVIGCRGRGTAIVRLRYGKHEQVSTCRGHRSWFVGLTNVIWTAHVHDTMHIITEPRR